jgi:hypothetical protein
MTVGSSGYTLDELSDYLDRGRQPAIPEIDGDAECQAVLASLERVGSLSRELVVRDEQPLDESFLAGLLGSITRELRAGRDIPLASSDPDVEIAITEGAIRELVRAAGDSVPGVLVGSCSLELGEQLGDELVVRLTISVLLGLPVHSAAEAVRQRVYSELLRHTQLAIGPVDVTVVDVHEGTL